MILIYRKKFMTIECSMVSESSMKKKVFVFFGLNPEASIECFKVLSKEAHQQIKKVEIFFRELELSEFSLNSND